MIRSLLNEQKQYHNMEIPGNRQEQETLLRSLMNIRMAAHEWKDAMYACLNYGEAYAPNEIKKKSICINGDIGDILDKL